MSNQTLVLELITNILAQSIVKKFIWLLLKKSMMYIHISGGHKNGLIYFVSCFYLMKFRLPSRNLDFDLEI